MRRKRRGNFESRNELDSKMIKSVKFLTESYVFAERCFYLLPIRLVTDSVKNENARKNNNIGGGRRCPRLEPVELRTNYHKNEELITIRNIRRLRSGRENVISLLRIGAYEFLTFRPTTKYFRW